MISQEVGGLVKKAGRGIFSRTFGKLFGFFFIFIFLIIPLIYSVVISVQAGSITPGINYMGQKFLNPLLTLGQESLIIIQNKGAFVDTGNFFSDLWRFILVYWNILGAFWIIWKWIRVFSWLYGHSFLSNDSQKFTNFSLAVITFIGMTFLYLSMIAQPVLHMTVIESWKIPIQAIHNFINAIPNLVTSGNSLVGESSITQVPNVSSLNITGLGL